MDYVSLSLYLSMALLLLRTGRYYLSVTISVPVRFLQAQSKYLKMVGGFWFFIVGAPLAAFFIVQFFFSNSYTLNLNTIISSLQTFSGPQLPTVLLFLALWALFSLAYTGGNALYQRNKNGKR